MKTIIVATDHSACAMNAVRYAASLAARTNAKFILLHAFQLSTHAANGLISAKGLQDLIDENQSRLETLAIQLQLEFGIRTESHCVTDFLEDALDKLVKEKTADLVVLGMHSTDWNDRFFGNTTLSVIKSAQYPLLIVPEQALYNGIKKILYAFDSKCLSSRNKLAMLRDIAFTYHAEVRVFHVETSPEFVPTIEKDPIINLKVEAALSQVDHTYKDIFSSTIAESIEKELALYKADLLAVVPHKAGLWYRLANKSTTRKLVLETPIPILVLPNKSIIE